MKDKLINIAKHSAVYSLGNISNKLVGFILLPLYTDALSTSQYGILAILEITAQVLVSLFSFNMHSALLRWCAEKTNEQSNKSIIFTTYVFLFILSGVLFLGGISSSEYLANLFFDTTSLAIYFKLIFLSSVIAIFNQTTLTVIRLEEKSVFFAIVNTLRFLITLLANVYFVAYLRLGIEGILWGTLAGQIIQVLVTIKFLLSRIMLKLNFPVLKEMVKYSYPLLFSTFGGIIIMLGDRYLLRFLSDFSSVGIYSLGFKISSVLRVVFINAFQLGFMPIAFKMAKENDAKEFYSNTLTYFTLILVFVSLGLSLFGQEVIELFTSNKDYYPSFVIIPVLTLGMIFQGMQFVFSISFHITKRTKNFAVINFFGAGLYLILNYFLILQFNYIGAAIAFLITYLILSLFTYFYSQKEMRVNYQLGMIVIILAFFIGAAGTLYLLADFEIYLRFIIKSLLVILFLFIAYLIHRRIKSTSFKK